MLRKTLPYVCVLAITALYACGGDADDGYEIGLPDSSGGKGGTSGSAGSGGIGGTPSNIADIVDHGALLVSQSPRPAFGGLLMASDEHRTYVVESRRDVEQGPFGIPWRSRFRLAAYEGVEEQWGYEVEPDIKIGDVVVHPSGDVTVSVERFEAAAQAYDLIRLRRDGTVVSTTTLVSPTTIPTSDYGPSDPKPLFRMKSDFADTTTLGWVRLVADGEAVYVALLSFVQARPDASSTRKMALGIEKLEWNQGTYIERWARVVEGTHGAEPTAWAYDELRWMEQAVRPFLARDQVSGDLLVGRAWNQSRCEANVAAFDEFEPSECVTGAVNPGENERLPLAVTRFDADGVRRGTHILRPAEDAAEQLPFALAARAGRLAVVGSVVRTLPDGSKRTYPDPSCFVDYDGYVSIYDAEGNLVRSHDVNQGRGDVLAALQWTAEGIVAVGSSGWDRWQGGMSISRGADPLVVWYPSDGIDTRARTLAVGNGTRHWNLHDVALVDGAVVAVGFSDAPMTHSADAGGAAARTFGPLQITLRP